MKKKLFLLCLILFPFTVRANSVSNIDMSIFIDDNGSAYVTEIWDAQMDSLTEGWHPYFNVGNARFSDLNVSMDGVAFTTVNNWDINDSFEEKKYKAGIYYAGDGEYDICFGITAYGRHIYQIKYKINNFILKLNDVDMLYWNLFPKDYSVSPRNIDVTIYGNGGYNDELPVWGFGKKGALAYVSDGKIHMKAENIKDSEYLTLLVKYDGGTFHTSNISDKDFNYYLDMAQKGAEKYIDFEMIFGFIATIVPFILVIIVGLFTASKNTKYRFGTRGNKISNDVNLFRDIPCNKDVFRAYWVARNYNLVKKKEDFLGAILLKWLMNGNVRIEKVMNGTFIKKEESNVCFIKEIDNNPIEAKLYKWMVEASGDNKLESGEFKKWCKKNYNKIINYFDDVDNYERDILITEGKIRYTEEKKSVLTHKYYDVDDSMMNEAEQMAGLKKFLKEFSVIDKREPIEVNLWNEYLIYAQIFGIANEVAKQFKKLYPEIMENMNELGYDYDDIFFMNAISNTGITSANDALAAARNYSAGGGGFSAGGGGGGAFGAGGGGGGFR